MRRTLVMWVMLAAGCAGARGQTAPSTGGEPDVVLAAARTWIARALFLRGFYAANELTYDPAGKVAGTQKTVDWTLAGMDVQAVVRKSPGLLELDGVRVAIRYNPDNRFFERHPQKDQKMKVLIATGPAGADSVEQALGAVFAVGIDPAMQRAMPESWRHFFDPRLPWPGDGLEGQTIYGLAGAPGGAQMVAPHVLAKPQAGYSAEAEHDKVQGTVGLRLVVDASGKARRLAIVKPLGYGLDARAVDAVGRWRFEPGTFQAKAVASGVDLSEEFLLVR